MKREAGVRRKEDEEESKKKKGAFLFIYIIYKNSIEKHRISSSTILVIKEVKNRSHTLNQENDRECEGGEVGLPEK